MNEIDKIIGVDVDLTVCDSVTPWKAWYAKLTGHDISKEITEVNNDLQDLMKRHSDPLSFWKKDDLYDDIEPFEIAIKVLTKLSDMGFTIVFVSSCFPEHENSKRMFLKRHFPMSSGFVSTSDKQFVKMDYFIDDYKKNLKLVQLWQPECRCFHVESGINKPDGFPFGDWDTFFEMILLDLNGDFEA